MVPRTFATETRSSNSSEIDPTPKNNKIYATTMKSYMKTTFKMKTWLILVVLFTAQNIRRVVSQDEVIMEGHKRPQMYSKPLPYTYVDSQRIPKSFSWHDVGGRSYLTMMRNQHIPQVRTCVVLCYVAWYRVVCSRFLSLGCHRPESLLAVLALFLIQGNVYSFILIFLVSILFSRNQVLWGMLGAFGTK